MKRYIIKGGENPLYLDIFPDEIQLNHIFSGARLSHHELDLICKKVAEYKKEHEGQSEPETIDMFEGL